MIIFVFIASFCWAFQFDLLKYVASIATPLQLKCADFFTQELLHRNLSQSFVCGTSIQNSFDQRLFQETGLIHLMVVSGSHLQLLSLFILWPWPEKIRAGRKLKWILGWLLFSYCLITGFQPPVVRAFICFTLRNLSDYFHWHWDSGKIHLASGFVLLSLIPAWIFSFSFYLSWLASLGFLLTPLCFTYKNKNWSWSEIAKNWFNSLTIQSLMSVGFLQFSVLSVLLNGLLAPVIAILLFPISLLVLILPNMAGLTDVCWDILLTVLRWSLWFPHPTDFSIPVLDANRWFYLWSFIASLHCGFELLRRYRYQKNYV
jgi:ComEC/Rec2-related protein